jgi:hypothetical protein
MRQAAAQQHERHLATGNSANVLLTCKDGQSVQFAFLSHSDYIRQQQVLQALAFPGNIEHTFAFHHKVRDTLTAL